MTPTVFIPGMMCDARLFQHQFAQLSGRFPMMSVPIGRHRTMTAIAEDVLRWAPERFALAGLSMGGIIAMEVLRLAPDRVVGLALMDTNPLAEAREVQEGRAAQISAAQAGDLKRVFREDMKPKYLADGPNQGAVLDLCMAMAIGLGKDFFVSQSIALRDRIDQTETLRRFDGPSLVLCGREDVLCPVDRHLLMHDLIADSTLQIVENAGHLPTLEQPEITTAALERWLEAL